MKPLKPSNTTLRSIHALAKTRSAPKEIRKLSQEYANPVSEDIERVEDLVGAIYKKSIGCFITQPISLGACLLKANQDQAFYDMAIQPGSNYIEKLESASKIECPASRDCAFMAVANDYGDDAHFDGLLEAARNHKDVATMQAFFKVIATDSTTNFFRAIKATKELTNLEEQQTILKDFYQDAKQKTYTAAPLLEIAKLTLDAALKETILFDAIAQPSLNKYDFKAQLTAYSLLSDKSQSPRTRLQILEDFFNPQFVHICSTLENGYRTTYDWLTDDLFSSLQDKEIDLVVRGLARSVPGPNNMDDKTQIHALNELSQKIVHFFGDNWELTTFMAALLYHPTIHFIALRTIIGRYLKDKSFDALLNCFQYLTQ